VGIESFAQRLEKARLKLALTLRWLQRQPGKYCERYRRLPGRQLEQGIGNVRSFADTDRQTENNFRPDTFDDGPGGFFSRLARHGHAASIATSRSGGSGVDSGGGVGAPEQRTENPRVSGSIPPLATTFLFSNVP
jgi:hypothetical protein